MHTKNAWNSFLEHIICKCFVAWDHARFYSFHRMNMLYRLQTNNSRCQIHIFVVEDWSCFCIISNLKTASCHSCFLKCFTSHSKQNYTFFNSKRSSFIFICCTSHNPFKNALHAFVCHFVIQLLCDVVCEIFVYIYNSFIKFCFFWNNLACVSVNNNFLNSCQSVLAWLQRKFVCTECFVMHAHRASCKIE